MLKALLARLWRGRSRIFFAFFLVVSVSTLLAPRVKAGFWDTIVEQFQEKTANDDLTELANDNAVCNEEGSANSGCTITNNNTIFFSDLTMRVIGVPEEATTAMSEESRIALYKIYGRGAVGDVQTGLVALYQPPATTQTYLADVLNSANIIPKASAQGLGFASLDPVLEAWKVFRNIAYLFFVAIFLVIGFMIMFRSKISGQTVVTAQQAIPQVIVALITVTFSYAIAGLLIDIMYLIMYMLVGLFSSDKSLVDMNIFEFGKTLLIGGSSAGGAVYDSITNFVGQLNLGGAGDALGFLSGITLALIISIAVLVGILRLFFDLLKTYVTIILLVAFSPVFLMLGAIPGKNPFKDWISQLVGNLSAFPAVLLLLIVYNLIMDFDITTGGFMPPYLLGQGAGSALVTLVGVGILLAMPETVLEIKKALGAKEGIFSKLAQDAWKRTKEAGWEGKGVPFGIAGKNIVGGAALAGTTAATSGLGALTGFGTAAIRGGGSMADRLTRGRMGAKEGAMYGAMVPAVTANLPKIVRGTTGATIKQFQDIAAKDVSGRITNAYNTWRGGKRDENRDKGLSQALSAEANIPQTLESTTDKTINQNGQNVVSGDSTY